MATLPGVPNPPAKTAARPRWSLRRVAGALGLFGFAASLWIHALAAVVGVLFGTWMLGSGFSSGVGHADRAIDLGTPTNLSELGAADPGGGAATLLDKPLDAAALTPTLSGLAAELPDPTATPTGAATLGGGAGDSTGFGTDSGAGGLGGSGLEGAGGGGAKFFGIEARGKRFAYLCDVSGSMEEERLAALKRELQTSIDELSSGSSCSIILFSSEARMLTGDGWVDAGPKGREQVRTLLRGVTSMGGTEPLPGFAMLFALRPRPDAVYFMTDGEFGRGQEDEIATKVAQLSRSGPRPVPVHCITLVQTEGAKIMQLIAKVTGGKYRHVPGAAAPAGVPPPPSNPGGKP